jgi:hypothetical protein
LRVGVVIAGIFRAISDSGKQKKARPSSDRLSEIPLGADGKGGVWQVTSETNSPSKAKPAKTSETVLGIAFFALITLFALGLGGVGVRKGFLDILRQDEALTTWKPVQAEVISVGGHPVPITGSGLARVVVPIVNAVFGVDSVVLVSYRYQVDGKAYVNGKPRPEPPIFQLPPELRNLSSEEKWSGQVGPPGGERALGQQPWAQMTFNRFVPGDACWAYYDPHDPSQAFVLKEYAFSPYWGTTASLIILLFGIFMAMVFVECWRNHPNPRPTPAFLIWFRWILAFSYSGANIWVLAHYWLHADQPLARGWAPITWSVLAGLVALGSSFAFVAYYGLTGKGLWGKTWPPPPDILKSKTVGDTTWFWYENPGEPK